MIGSGVKVVGGNQPPHPLARAFKNLAVFDALE
jgi:hypothetical protein